MQSKPILISDGSGLAASILRNMSSSDNGIPVASEHRHLTLDSLTTVNPDMMDTYYRTVRKTPKKKRKEQKASRRKNRK